MGRVQDRRSENETLTYYDELGLPASASDEEIRRAYLNLVRLLHADAQPEASLKRFAEAQLKRASRAHAVLADPERRRRYDAELASGGQEMDTPAPNSRMAGRSRARALITLGWLICAFAGAVGIGWYVSQQPGSPPAPAQVNAAPAPPDVATKPPNAAGPSQPQAPAAAPADSSELDSLRSELADAKSERDRALDEIALQKKELDFLASRIVAGPSGVAAGCSRFAGLWVLPQARTAPVTSAYTPETVDLILGERAGSIQGRYWARYPGMGSPDPPLVHFYFEGQCQNDAVNAAWSGVGGSKGEVQLRLASDNALQLVWSVTDTGKQTGPASGTVALVRKRAL